MARINWTFLYIDAIITHSFKSVVQIFKHSAIFLITLLILQTVKTSTPSLFAVTETSFHFDLTVISDNYHTQQRELHKSSGW